MIGTGLGRHVNDHMTSFDPIRRRSFWWNMVWGGRSIDPANWMLHERGEGPSLWGHTRTAAYA